MHTPPKITFSLHSSFSDLVVITIIIPRAGGSGIEFEQGVELLLPVSKALLNSVHVPFRGRKVERFEKLAEVERRGFEFFLIGVRGKEAVEELLGGIREEAVGTVGELWLAALKTETHKSEQDEAVLP